MKQYTAQQLLNVLGTSWTHMLDAINTSACLDQPVLGVLCTAVQHMYISSRCRGVLL